LRTHASATIVHACICFYTWYLWDSSHAPTHARCACALQIAMDWTAAARTFAAFALTATPPPASQAVGHSCCLPSHLQVTSTCPRAGGYSFCPRCLLLPAHTTAAAPCRIHLPFSGTFMPPALFRTLWFITRSGYRFTYHTTDTLERLHSTTTYMVAS